MIGQFLIPLSCRSGNNLPPRRSVKKLHREALVASGWPSNRKQRQALCFNPGRVAVQDPAILQRPTMKPQRILVICSCFSRVVR